jgi:hypothetical protein
MAPSFPSIPARNESNGQSYHFPQEGEERVIKSNDFLSSCFPIYRSMIRSHQSSYHDEAPLLASRPTLDLRTTEGRRGEEEERRRRTDSL